MEFDKELEISLKFISIIGVNFTPPSLNRQSTRMAKIKAKLSKIYFPFIAVCLFLAVASQIKFSVTIERIRST